MTGKPYVAPSSAAIHARQMALRTRSGPPGGIGSARTGGSGAAPGAPDSVVYNPVPHPAPKAGDESHAAGTLGDRVVIVMVGLPARGKTFIARKVASYLSFFHGAPVRVCAPPRVLTVSHQLLSLIHI